MTDEETILDVPILGELTTGTTLSTDIVPKPGWKTSQGQLTALFVMASMVLSFFNFSYTPEQLGDLYDKIYYLIISVGPIIAAVTALIPYMYSRNSLQKTAILENSKTAQINAMSLTGGGFDFGKLLGGDSWKDPERYINITKIGGKLGVPGLDKVSSILNPDDNQKEFNEQIVQAINQLAANQTALNEKFEHFILKQ